VKHWGAWALLRCYDPVLANPPGGGLVPHGWGCSMPRVMVWAPEVPPGPPISGHGQQFDISFPSYYQVPIDVTPGWAASLVNTRSPAG